MFKQASDAANATNFHQPALLVRLLGALQRRLIPAKPDCGCAVCRDTHFELGAAAAGQEYL